jgi:glycerate 2-kinase
MPLVVVAPDKFRGTATAADAARAMALAATSLGWEAVSFPLSDGGEGLLEACAPGCPEVHTTVVSGPDGRPVEAEWCSGPGLAVVESARASGLTLAGGREDNDALTATSRGTGELLIAAARVVGPGGTVVLGLGGSATTDGGSGALAAVEEAGGLGGVTLVGACDVDVAFVDAAPLFAPQKGASPDDVTVLAERLERLAREYVVRYGVDVRVVSGAGAAGGLGGAVSVLGGELRSGYDLVAGIVGLRSALASADRVITGEGGLDGPSFRGKVVGGVVTDALATGTPTLIVAGRVAPGATATAEAAGADVVSLTERFGRARATVETMDRITEVTGDWLGPAARGVRQRPAAPEVSC